MPAKDRMSDAEISVNHATRILRADAANLAKKVKAGRTLTAPERQLLLNIRRGENSPSALIHSSSQAALAKVLGVKQATIAKYRKRAGNPGKRSDGDYEIEAWRRFLTQCGVYENSMHANGDHDLNGNGTGLAALKSRQVSLRNERLEIENKVRRGELVEWNEAAQRQAQSILAAKARLEQIVLLAPQLTGLTTPEIQKRLREGVDAALKDLSSDPFGESNANQHPD